MLQEYILLSTETTWLITKYIIFLKRLLILSQWYIIFLKDYVVKYRKKWKDQMDHHFYL